MGLTGTLIAFAGLPGTGKSTIARAVAAELDAVYLRVDTVEQALRRSGEVARLVTAGYEVLYALCADNLVLGRVVVADSVNPFALTRAAWRETAERAGAHFLAVEIVCTDTAEHRRRVETRKADIEGFELPDWQAVVDRDYEDWADADIRIDTAKTAAAGAAARILAHLDAPPPMSRR